MQKEAMAKRRGMTDKEFRHFHDYVKCPWLDCAGGLGLAGRGVCSWGGDWTDPECPDYITEEDYIDDNSND